MASARLRRVVRWVGLPLLCTRSYSHPVSGGTGRATHRRRRLSECSGKVGTRDERRGEVG